VFGLCFQLDLFRTCISQLYAIASKGGLSETGVALESYIVQLISELPFPSPGIVSLRG
jgi:hypothetical protein